MPTLVAPANHREWLIDNGFKAESVDNVSRQILRFYDRQRMLDSALRGKSNYTNYGYKGYGNPNADVMIVSDFPDASESTTGYIGFSEYATLLMSMLTRFGLNFEDIFWTTAIKEDIEHVTMDIIERNRVHLQNEVIVVNPSVIIAMGTTGVSAILGKPKKIQKVLGTEQGYNVHDSLGDVPVLCIEHPKGYIMNPDRDFRTYVDETWGILKRLEDIL